MDTISLVLATNNVHKVSEIRSILPKSYTFITLQEAGVVFELPETSGTIKGNAVQKALTVWEATGCSCIADDSGLEVQALNGRPGVDSAHFAGLPANPHRNLMFLLDQMEGVKDRSARFVTVIALVIGGQVYTFEGIVDGNITEVPRGGGGFGYDPVFVPEGVDVTFAEMSDAQKNTISHRAKALRALQVFLEA